MLNQLKVEPKEKLSEHFAGRPDETGLDADPCTNPAPMAVGTEWDQWRNTPPLPFTEVQRAHTTALFGGLTAMHDSLIEAGMARLGFKSQALPCPDNRSLQIGREFGNRAQCNPTYFTVGNLLKHLRALCEQDGMTPQEVVKNYIFLTIGGCGPCRFGTYITEYRKSLRDAGFDGFRVYDVRNFGQHRTDPSVAGLRLDVPFYITFFKCLMVGDVMNMIGYRTRPYELIPGTTDAALAECRAILCDAFRKGRSLYFALWRCRKIMSGVAVDRTEPRPKVAIIGEFWAMTTDGDGNYHLQRFLEREGAECDIQPVSTWALYEIWEVQYDTRERMKLKRRNGERHSAEPDSPISTLASLWVANFVIRTFFSVFAKAAGLPHAALPDMEHLARIADEFYPNQLRGGEGHMEVAKVIEAVSKNKAHMVVSVKPFGCMPSSGVSDGVQSLVTARYPQAIFCPIETTGDGAVGVYSRIQMALFKARQRAQDEFRHAAEKAPGTPENAGGRRAQHDSGRPVAKHRCRAPARRRRQN